MSVKPPPLPSARASVAGVAPAPSDDDFIELVILREQDVPTPVRVRRGALLGKAFDTYAAYKHLNPLKLRFFAKDPPVEVSGTDTAGGLGLVAGDALIAAPFVPFTPAHSEHCDLTFTVGDCTFRAHKYPMLRSGSGLVESLLEGGAQGEAIPLDIPGGPRVFDIVSRFCHSEHPDDTLAECLTPANFVAVRVGASFLQMDRLAVACDAWLDRAVLPSCPATIAVLLSALETDAASLPENNIIGRCAAALAITTDWASEEGRRRVAALPPPAFVDVVLAAESLKMQRRDLTSAVLEYLTRHLGEAETVSTSAGSVAVEGGALLTPGDGSSVTTPLSLSSFHRVMHLIDPGALSARQGLLLLAPLQSSADVTMLASRWLSALTHGASSGDGVDTPEHAGVMDMLQLCVFVLSAHAGELVDEELAWVAAPVLALVLRQASVPLSITRLILAAYLSSRATDGGSVAVALMAPPVPLTQEDLERVLLSTMPHHRLCVDTSVEEGLRGRGQEEAEDEVVGQGSVAEFYGAVLSALVWLFAHAALSVEARDAALSSLCQSGALQLCHLAPSTLRACISSASLPSTHFITALLTQNELLVRQVISARGAVASANTAQLRARVCAHSHVPVGTRLAVKRSKGEFASGIVRGYSPDTGMHAVVYGQGDKRWYDLSRTVYEVMGALASSEEEESDSEASGSGEDA
ncbi:MAG: hypothetical protein P4L40_03315 [Terracidiphilus sp.]|nr:hypothetical protein [Terracidiphilus sp.]